MGIIYFVLIPLLLVLIFTYSNDLKNLLILNLHNPTLLSMIGSNYIHSSFNHLVGNVLFYYLIMIFVFAFDALTNRTMFSLNLPLFFLILPLICSSLMIFVFNSLEYNITSNGFSGVVSCLFGYLSFSLFHFIKEYYNIEFKRSIFQLMWVILLINLFLISLIYGFILVLPIILVLCILPIYYTKNDFNKIFTLLNKIGPLPRGAILVSFILCLCLGIQFLFPETITSDGNITNIFLHYIGYIFGIFFTGIISTYLINRK